MTQNPIRFRQFGCLSTLKVCLTVVVAFACVGLLAGCPLPPADPAQRCINSGGTAGTAMCCLSTADYPDTCAIGACGCSPENSHEVTVCDCGAGRCFNGLWCVDAP